MLSRLIILGTVLLPLAVMGQPAGQQGLCGEEAAADSLPSFPLEEFRQKTLQEGEIFLDAYTGQELSHIFAVTKTQCQMLDLPGEEDLKPLLSRLHQLASNVDSDQAELSSVAAQVSDLLLGDLAGKIEFGDNIIFAPHGIFNLIPTSLLLPDSRNITFVRVPSASILMDLRSSAAQRLPAKKPRTLAVGGVLDPDNPDLPEARQELKDLDDVYKGVTVVRPNGGGGVPELDKLLGFDIIHVAAQCIGDDRNAWQSAIALDPSNPDMMIRVSDLKEVKLDTRLVVLARCSSASGQVLSGEGLQGLTTAFLVAGVQAVVAALWPVDDDATGFFMAAFYEGLSLGQDARGALAFAREKCRQDPVFHLPYHWGAFVLVGEGQVEVPLHTKSGLAGWGRLLVLLAGAGAGLYFILRNYR